MKRLGKEKLKIYIIRNRLLIGFLALILIAVSIPIISFMLITGNNEEPYFINIDDDQDFLQWCDIGNGTVENPYIIADHHITVPESWESSCPPALISINGVSKSFIIENNTLSLKNGCGGNAMIRLSNVAVPFAVRNNILTGYNKIGIYLNSVNGQASNILNNQIKHACIEIWSSNNVNISSNHFYDTSTLQSNYIRESNNISFQNNLFDDSTINFYECSQVDFQNNTFNIAFTDTHISFWSLSGYNANFSRITDNTFLNSGLGLLASDNLPEEIAGNIINGKPLGLFFNKSDLIIDNSTKYGQIILIGCFNVTINEQSLNKTYYAIEIMECLNTTIQDCSFGNNSYGIYIWKSNNTLIYDNQFQWTSFGTHGIGVYGKYAEGLQIKSNLFINLGAAVAYQNCNNIVEENNTIL